MLPWVERPTLDIDLDRPLKERYDGVPPEAVQEGRRLLAAVMEAVPPAARVLADWVRLRTANRFHYEAVSLARRIDVSWRDILLANVSYDLMLAYFGCSTVVLPTPSGPVLGRNMDWWPEDVLAQTTYRIRCYRQGILHLASAGWPGGIGVVTGLSGRGFAVALNAVLGPEKVRMTGYPVLLHLRRVLDDARDFEDALRMLADTTLAAPALFTLVGVSNSQRVVIERTPSRHALRWPRGDEPLITTNDYRLLFQPETSDAAEIYATTCSRYDYLQKFFAQHQPDREVEDAAILYALSDPAVIQSITAQHVLMRPRSGELRVFVPRHLCAHAAHRTPG
jgi:hypothetical protein